MIKLLSQNKGTNTEHWEVVEDTYDFSDPNDLDETSNIQNVLLWGDIIKSDYTQYHILVEEAL